ncbi:MULTISPECIES: hypothetical protein [unclassified Synechococcus]|uniref:hypothetical protein n=1 Tax=unclassified Synechococcus TaxID=2626047 RepID=UPI00069D0B75|nr:MULTISPECIES: hypothetical protein [unclassified Synechococcus]
MKLLILILVSIYGLPSNGFGGNFMDDTRTDKEAFNTATSYPVFHAKCMEKEMVMWGEVAELMVDLSTSHCYCKYTELQNRESYSLESQDIAASSCYRQATMDKKAEFIWWALPLHRQKMKE